MHSLINKWSPFQEHPEGSNNYFKGKYNSQERLLQTLLPPPYPPHTHTQYRHLVGHGAFAPPPLLAPSQKGKKLPQISHFRHSVLPLCKAGKVFPTLNIALETTWEFLFGSYTYYHYDQKHIKNFQRYNSSYKFCESLCLGSATKRITQYIVTQKALWIL